MAICKDCKCFFVFEDNPEKGDCVQRVVDPRQAYCKAKPVEADQDASNCSSFQRSK
jgi:benzylsuccinate synthase